MEAGDCLLIRAGRIEYGEAYELQKRLLEKKLSGESRDFLILAEHEPVITLGRGFKKNNLLLGRDALLKRGISAYDIERGGDATYHGPGQLVGYPLFDLTRRGRDLRIYIASLEEVIISTLADFKISAERKEGGIGVWHNGKKIASIGVAVKKWVSYHGFALNIFTDLKNFSFINPCGLDYNVMTSMESILGYRTPLREVEERITGHFCDIFSLEFKMFEGDRVDAKGY